VSQLGRQTDFIIRGAPPREKHDVTLPHRAICIKDWSCRSFCKL